MTFSLHLDSPLVLHFSNSFKYAGQLPVSVDEPPIKKYFSLFSRLTIFSSHPTRSFNGQYTCLTIILSQNNMYEGVYCTKTSLKLKTRIKRWTFAFLPKNKFALFIFPSLFPKWRLTGHWSPRGNETGPAQTLCEHIIPHLKHSSHNEFFTYIIVSCVSSILVLSCSLKVCF